MQKTSLSALALLTASAIWGFAFVAQRVGMEHLGPFYFTAIRFGIGAVVTALLASMFTIAAEREGEHANSVQIFRSVITGIALFGGASLQQIGLVYTTAGKAGFITGLYVIFVPVIGIFLGRRTSSSNWFGAALASTGMYLLCYQPAVGFSKGDLLTLCCAVIFAAHILLTSWAVQIVPPLKAAIIQYFVCGFLSFAAATILETCTLRDILNASGAILYGGVGSVGIAYTLYTIAQKRVHPSYAAIILAAEAPFAAIGGSIALGEKLTHSELFGCAVILAGILAAQPGLIETLLHRVIKPHRNSLSN